MDSVDLREMREKLRCYKENGKTVTIAILKQLLKTDLDPRQLEQSKIHKSLHVLSHIDPLQEIGGDFSEKDLASIKSMSSQLLKLVKELTRENQQRKNSVVSTGSGEVKQSVQPTPVKEKKGTKKPTSTAPTPAPISEPKSGLSEQRQRAVNILITKMKHVDLDPAKVDNFCTRFENEANKLGKSEYEEVIKQACKHFKDDNNLSVRSRFLKGLIDISRAVKMKSEDWLSDQRIIESRVQASEAIKANDTAYYKKIAQEINMSSKLNKCEACGEEKLQLINEIQTRASDEPTTKFWSCLNCGNSMTTN